ncbi:MAG: hypothetical protein ACREP3_12415 [Candidatus Binatia bacterium]
MKTSLLTAALILCLAATSSWSQSRARLNVIYPAIVKTLEDQGFLRKIGMQK